MVLHFYKCSSSAGAEKKVTQKPFIEEGKKTFLLYKISRTSLYLQLQHYELNFEKHFPWHSAHYAMIIATTPPPPHMSMR